MATKKQVTDKFNLFCSIYNLKTTAVRTPQGPEFYSNAYIKLDYNPTYGGYRLDVVNPDTSERFFYGASRKSGAEMLSYLDGLIDAKNPRPFEGILISDTFEPIK